MVESPAMNSSRKWQLLSRRAHGVNKGDPVKRFLKTLCSGLLGVTGEASEVERNEANCFEVRREDAGGEEKR